MSSDRAIDRIKSEHRALARILAAMQVWTVHTRGPGVRPKLALFDAMLRYVENVPDRLHHPKEDGVLFPAVARLERARAVVAELEREHAQGAAMLGELRQAFHSLIQKTPNALNQLSASVDDFAEFYWAHM